MGVEPTKTVPPLPAPTDSNSTGPETPVATELSRVTDKTHYSVPDDGSPITISTRKKRDHNLKSLESNNGSQTSLLIEYFEASKNAPTTSRRPSIRVKVTPSSKSRGKSSKEPHHIEITERPSGSRKASYTKRINLAPTTRGDKLFGEELDTKSLKSYSSLTEESNLTSRSGRIHPVEIEVGAPRRHPSPLIPTDDHQPRLQHLDSDISSLPANSFLDGTSREHRRSRSLSRGEAPVGGTAAGLAAGAVLQSPTRRHSRSLSRDRLTEHQSSSKKNTKDVSQNRRKHRERSGSIDNVDNHAATLKSPHRRSSRGHDESVLSTDSSYLKTSRTSKVSSINNPKLLETVEDAIRRLILPELTALKKEQKANINRRQLERERRGSITSGSSGLSRDHHQEHTTTRKVSNRSSAPEIITGSAKDSVTDTDAALSGARFHTLHGAGDSTISDDRQTTSTNISEKSLIHKMKSKEGLSEREERRRRLKDRRNDSIDASRLIPITKPPMPMMSDVTESDLTRTSILPDDTDRAYPINEEHVSPVHKAKRGYISPVDSESTDLQTSTLRFLGVQHANTSIADIDPDQDSTLSRDYHQSSHPGHSQLTDSTYDGSVIEDHRMPVHRGNNSASNSPSHKPINNVAAAEAASIASDAMLRSRYTDVRSDSMHREHELQLRKQFEEAEEYRGSSDEEVHQPYGREYSQTVPSPLRYVPYSQQRGLSPIPQSVSSYREDENKTNRSTSMSTINESLRQKNLNTGDAQHDLKQARQSGQANSKLAADSEVSREQQTEHDKLESPNLTTKHNVDSLYTNSSVMGSDSQSGVQTVHAIGATPGFVNPPLGVESNVASLHSGTNATASNLTTDKPLLRHQASNASFDEGSERHFTYSPTKGYRRDELDDDSDLESPTKYPEYELDEQGRKITMPDYKTQSSSTEHTIDKKTMGAATLAAAAAIARYAKGRPRPPSQRSEHSVEDVPQRNRSFKERASQLRKSSNLTDISSEHAKLGASGLPDMYDPMPEIGHYQDDVSVDSLNARRKHSQEAMSTGRSTPTQNHYTYEHEEHTPGLQKAELAMISAANALGASAAVAQHDRNNGQALTEEWLRTSDERKRDTIMTNPFEGQSPNANHANQFVYESKYGMDRSAHESKDEGYISSVPNPPHSIRRKEVGFSNSTPQMSGGNGLGSDPFYQPQDTTNMDNHMRSTDTFSNYDSATRNNMEKIQNGDIVALMNHLTSRDAQRSARDTEILMTLVQAAAEMRNSFIEMRKLILDSEDVIIQEVEKNTDLTTQKRMIDTKPLPQGLRKLKSSSQDDYMSDIPEKRRNVFRRALAGLSSKGSGSHDLAHIEDMLVRLLGDVEGLKTAGKSRGPGYDGYDGEEQEGYVKHDSGYEPEGHAGSSAASQSGYLSGGSRINVNPRHVEQPRRASNNRVSTVHEDDEEDVLDSQEQTLLDNQFEKNERLMTTQIDGRGASLPPSTPTRQFAEVNTNSNDNTPTEKSKKHKSIGSSGFIPKISRWSETTASTIANKFKRNSKHKDYEYPPSRSGSYFDQYDEQEHDSHDRNEGNSNSQGFSQQYRDQPLSPQRTHESGRERYPYGDRNPLGMHDMSGAQEEEPKYTAQRHSLLLDHPQPSHGPTHVHRTQLEGAADTFGPVSPQSVQWDSTTSVNRLPMNANLMPTMYQPTSLQIPIRSHSAVSEYDYDDLNAYMRAGKGEGGTPPVRPPKEELSAPAKPPKEQIHASVSPGSVNLGPNVQLRAQKYLRPGATSNDVHNDDSGLQSHQIPRSFSGGKFDVPTRKPTGPRAMAGRGAESSNDTGMAHQAHVDEGGMFSHPAISVVTCTDCRQDIMSSPKSTKSNDTETF